MIVFQSTHPILLVVGGVLALAAALLLLTRRGLLGGWVVGLLTLGALCLALAAGGLRVSVPAGRPIQVLLDVSPSTRTAAFRDENALQRRLDELLGAAPYQVVRFEERPVFSGPSLLFSDGRFGAKPPGAAVFCVVDPSLSRPADARLLEDVSEPGTILIENSGRERSLRLAGQEVNIPPGRHRLHDATSDTPVIASLEPGDAWPENDRLELLPPPLGKVARLACGIEVPGLEQVTPFEISSHASSLSSTSILVLDAGLTAQLTDAQQQAIASWVRNLGGSVLLIGHNAGWANLRGAALGEISPLSADPPTPTKEWIILIDASGSMAQIQDRQDKWAAALAAGRRLLASLPGNDLARVGLFSTNVQWIAAGTVSELELAPAVNFVPRGPTNLDRALQTVVELPEGKRELVLMTDAEVELPNAAQVIAEMRARDLRVSCLTLSEGRGKALLQELASATGGIALTEVGLRLWSQRAGELAGRLAPGHWREGEVEVIASGPLGQRRATIRGYNESFPRQGASVLAEAAGRPVAASWQVGLGTVGAASFLLPRDWAAALADEIERQPVDARFSVDWTRDRVRIAGPVESNIRLHVAGTFGETELPVEEVAPGRFEAALPDLSTGAHVAVLDGGRILDRRVFSPSYPREFAAIGNDLDRLRNLAIGSGGRVIGPEERRPIPELRSRRFLSLVPFLGVLGLSFLAGGVMLLRRRL